MFYSKDRTAGIFWHNAAETWVDVLSSADNNVVESFVNFVSGSTKKSQVDVHFMSESGVIDVFFMLGPKPLDVFRQFTVLTGTAPLPQVYLIYILMSIFFIICLSYILMFNILNVLHIKMQTPIIINSLK